MSENKENKDKAGQTPEIISLAGKLSAQARKLRDTEAALDSFDPPKADAAALKAEKIEGHIRWMGNTEDREAQSLAGRIFETYNIRIPFHGYRESGDFAKYIPFMVRVEEELKSVGPIIREKVLPGGKKVRASEIRKSSTELDMMQGTLHLHGRFRVYVEPFDLAKGSGLADIIKKYATYMWF